MMTLEITPDHADFRLAGRLAGRYHYRDPFKPFVHPVATPLGHAVSLANPHDHQHHRGMMYSLRCADCNFFEEKPPEGVQRHLAFDAVDAAGPAVGFTQRLAWRALAGDREYFRETRSLRCAYAPAKRAFVWDWRTELTASTDCELIKSQWSVPDAQGTPINYHGMCLRLRRDFAGPAKWLDLFADGNPTPQAELHGSVRPSVTWIGRIDGTLPVERAGVTLTQSQQHTLFLIHEPFGFLSMGPSNRDPLPLKTGQTLREQYQLEVFDADPL